MKLRSMLATLLILAALPAWAELVEIAERDGQTLYLDVATLQIDGTLRRAWTVCRYPAPSPEGALSTKSHMEYDCARGRYRILVISTHPDCMAEGEALHLEAAAQPWWRDVLAGTVAARLLDNVCAR